MIIVRYNSSARVVSYRVLSRFLEMFKLNMIQIWDTDEHNHALIDDKGQLIGSVEYKEAL